MLYCQAELPHSGLANKLFTWGRCKVFSSIHNVPMLATRWEQWTLGPLLRGELDLRWYRGLFQPSPSEIRAIKCTKFKFTMPRLAEPAQLNDRTYSKRQRGIVLFRGRTGFFAPLNGWHVYLRQELYSTVQQQHLRLLRSIDTAPIGIHIRCGDFPAEEQTPVNWFVGALRHIREELGGSARAYVCSDASTRHLEPLLNEEGVELIRNNALVELLLLSRSKILLASAGSTFSAWAAFLGQMPCIWRPRGFPLEWWHFVAQEGQYVGEFDPETPPSAFVALSNWTRRKEVRR